MSRSDASPSEWFRIAAPRPAPELRLVCLPHAGGSAALYESWSSLLPPSIEVWAVQLPGRTARFRERPIDRLGEIVERVGDAIRRHVPGPRALFGHSMGALVAYEIAASIGDGSIDHLVVSSHEAPGTPIPGEPLHTMSNDQLVRRLSVLGGLPPELVDDPELQEILLPQLRADLQALETWSSPARPVDHALTVLAAIDDPVVDRVHVDGWRDMTTGSFRRHWFPGGHFYLSGTSEAAALQTIADALTDPSRGR